MTPPRGDWEPVRLVLLVVITLVYVANFIAGLVIEEYQPDPTIGAVFMLVAGFLYVTKNSKGGGE